MMPDHLMTRRRFWALRRPSIGLPSAQICSFDQNKLSWRLSFLIILVLSLALWAAIREGVSVPVRNRF
jgi:hypothetical protein